ncbi:S-layer homology domain-containing protein [Sporosarcina sp. FSL K6-1522]|uniref:S-layer homology domain-containing protein n=1 Tax=Sporosarcina sp. FSL K6-1522 TaxID=2921554 RepID=UPI00315B3BFD
MAQNKAKFNKFMTGAVTATMVATAIVPVASAASFTDTDNLGDQVKAEVNKAVELGFFNDGTKFNPSANITRGQAALTLARYIAGDSTLKAYAEAKGLEGKVTAFVDVPASYKNGETFQQELFYASLIVKNAGAFTQDNLNPAANVTRSQMAKIVTTTFGLEKAADFESKITDINHLDAATKGFIETLAANEVTNVTTFNPAGNVTRSQMASFLVRSYDVVNPGVAAPEVVSVSAINATSAKVTFKNALPVGADFNNFEISGGLIVTEAKVSADRKSVELTFNAELTKNQEYTVTATGFKDADGKVYADSKGTFTWEVAEGVTVALEQTTAEQGDKFGITVKDAAGKDVKDAKVTAVSYNENILTSSAQTSAEKPEDVEFEAKKVAGTVDVEVKTELPDGTILTNSFKVTVKEEKVTIANSGFTLVPTGTNILGAATDGTEYKLANTAAFKAFATAKTSVTLGDSADLYAFAETNGNPDISAIDWEDTANAGKKEVTNVKSSNAIVADVAYAAGVITVTGNSIGKSTITVTFKDGSKKTFDIEVKDVAKFKDISVKQTSVKLSDDARTPGTEGVDKAVIDIETIDQFDKLFTAGVSGTGFVTVTSSTDGITVGAPGELNTAAGRADRLNIVGGVGTLTIQAEESKIVKNAKVTLSYFAKSTDTKPTSTKVVTVNVVDVDASVDASDLDVVIGNDTIDANWENVTTTSTTVYEDVAFADFDAFLLDGKGNRIGTTAVSASELLTKTDANVVVASDNTTIAFADTDAQTYLRAADTVTVKVTGDDTTKTISKNVKVSYKNSAVLPNAAKVSTNAVSIKVDPATYTLEDILFGIVDEDQLVLDDSNAVNIAVKKNAKNAGYKYNTPLVTLTGTDGKPLAFGTALYGSTLTELGATTAIWNNDFINNTLLANGFATDGFEYDLAVSNVVSTSAADNTASTAGVAVTAGNSVTFTLVVKGIYTDGAKAKAVANAEAHATLLAGSPVTLTQAEKDAAEATQNLLAAPVQLNISVAGK